MTATWHNGAIRLGLELVNHPLMTSNVEVRSRARPRHFGVGGSASVIAMREGRLGQAAPPAQPLSLGGSWRTSLTLSGTQLSAGETYVSEDSPYYQWLMCQRPTLTRARATDLRVSTRLGWSYRHARPRPLSDQRRPSPQSSDPALFPRVEDQ